MRNFKMRNFKKRNCNLINYKINVFITPVLVSNINYYYFYCHNSLGDKFSSNSFYRFLIASFSKRLNYLVLNLLKVLIYTLNFNILLLYRVMYEASARFDMFWVRIHYINYIFVRKLSLSSGKMCVDIIRQ